MTPQELWNAVPPRSLIQLMDSDGLNTVYRCDDNLGKYLRISSDEKWSIVRRDGGRIATVWPWDRDFRSQDFVIVARDVDPCASDDEIKRLAAGKSSRIEVGDIVDWCRVPDGTVVRATRPGVHPLSRGCGRQRSRGPDRMLYRVAGSACALNRGNDL